MTNEEARDQIVIFMCDEQKVINDRDKQALDMAIKALETIPKYKDTYNKGWEDGAKATYEHLKMCKEEQEIKTDSWSIKEVANAFKKHGIIQDQEPSGDLISKQAVIDAIKHAQFNFQIISTINFADYKKEVQEIVDNILSAQIKAINDLPSVNPQEPKWIPVNERVAEFPCLACDIFDQIFIPSGIVVLNSRCYEGKDFDFNVEKFLRGKEVIMCGGKKAYLRPREIAAWMPLPEPYEPQERSE